MLWRKDVVPEPTHSQLKFQSNLDTFIMPRVFPSRARPSDLGLQCCTQLREIAVAFRRRRGSMRISELAELRIQGFQTVGGLQAYPCV